MTVALKIGLGMLLFPALVWADNSHEERLSSLFHQANQAYDQGNYVQAISHYEQMEELGLNNGEVFYNLGNAYFRNGNSGKAIFYYRKALGLSPRDADIKFNLDYARQKTVDQVEDNRSWWEKGTGMLSALNEKETYVVFFLGTALFFLSLTVTLFRRNDLWRWTRLATFVIFLAGAAMVLIKTLETSGFGTVTVRQAKVYSAVGRDNVVLFTLHEGTEFSVLKTLKGDWIQIQLADNKKGWVSAEDVSAQR